MTSDVTDIASVQAMVDKRVAEENADLNGAIQGAEGTPKRHPFFDVTPEQCSFRRFSKKPPDLPMVIDGLGFRGMAALISGVGGVGKTTVEIQIAASLATGKPLLGNSLAPRVQGRTLVFLPEDPEIPIWQKIYNLAESLGVDGTMLLDHTHGPEAYGVDMRLVIKSPSGLKTTEAFEAVLDLARRIPGLVCIIFDPLNLMQDADVEKEPGAAQFFANCMARIARETNTLVLVAHHAVKGASGEKFDMEKSLHQDSIRGSGAIVNGFRAALTLVTLPQNFAKKHLRLGEEPKRGEYVAALVAKNNYTPKGDIFILRRDDNGILWPVDDSNSRAIVRHIKKTVVLERLIPIIITEVTNQEAQNKRFTKTTFAQVYSKTWKSSGDVDASQSTIRAAIERALADQYLRTKILPRENGKDAEYLTVKDALPLPSPSNEDDPNAWLWGMEREGDD